MWKTIADGLDVTGDGPAADAVTGYLGDRRALLVLDNLEQLHGAAGVDALATSSSWPPPWKMAAANAAQLGEALRAARISGAAEVIRQATGIPIKQPELLERYLAPARATLAAGQWEAELAAGRALTQQQAAALLPSPSPSPSQDTLQ